MDHETLRTASTYLNNLLLARGLLRPPVASGIDFVKPTRDARAHTINLIHDLLLRDDRARDQRDATAHLLRQLRAESTRQAEEISRLTARAETEARAAAQARAAQEKAEAEVKRLEGRVKALKEEAGRLKTSLAQTKAGCATEVRKRDLELSRLKGHLQGQQRGGKHPGGGVGAVVGPNLTISGGVAERRQKQEEQQQQRDVQDPEYSLRQETNSFLTSLAQSLSEENDTLLTHLRHALHTLHDLLNLPAPPPCNPQPDSLAADLSRALSALTSLLRDPNFVPLEELLEREEEIARLRAGWEHMEARWRDLLSLMEGWRRRMEEGGHTVDLEDLRRGIGMVSPVRRGGGEGGKNEVEDLSITEEASERSADDGDHRSSKHEVASHRRRSTSASPTSPRKNNARKQLHNVFSPPSCFDLRPRANSNPASSPLPRAGDAAPPTSDPDSDSDSDSPPLTVAEKLQQAELAAAAAAAAAASASPTNKKPVPLADRPNPPPSSKSAPASDFSEPPFTQSKRSARLSFGVDGANDHEDDTLGQLVSAASPVQAVGAKRTKIRGRPKKRRKSTLTAEELERLIFTGGDGADEAE